MDKKIFKEFLKNILDGIKMKTTICDKAKQYWDIYSTK